MRIREWMQSDPPTVGADAPVAEAQRLAEEAGLAVVLVVGEQGELVGFLTRRALAAAPTPELAARKLAAAPTVILSPDDPMERAVVLLQERYVLLPVVDGGRLVGVLTRQGLMRALARMCGFGEAGTRIRLVLRSATEIYRALEVLAQHDVELVAAVQGEPGEMILHVRGVEERDDLSRKLEEALG
ncbi:MAG: CBS domain-containing protein [Candidatus Bipolaricaulota bacterium]